MSVCTNKGSVGMRPMITDMTTAYNVHSYGGKGFPVWQQSLLQDADSSGRNGLGG